MVLIVFAALYIWALGFSLYVVQVFKKFLDRNPRISSTRSLEEYKAVVKVNMYGALVQGGVLLLAMIMCLVVVYYYGMPGLLLVILSNCLVIGFAMYLKKFEKRAKELPTDSEELAAEYRRITETWIKKALPDF